METFLNVAYAVLKEGGPLSAKAIVEAAKESGRLVTKGRTPNHTMGSRLATDIKRKGKNSRFVRVGPGLFDLRESARKDRDSADAGTGPASEQGAHGGLRATLPAPSDAGTGPASELNGRRDMNQTRIGAAGEFRVMSELLLRGYNADRVTIDKGIDIRAAKGGSTYEIQVKTVTEWKTGNKFVITIKKEAFERVNDPHVYYVFVLRHHDNSIKHVIIPNKEMKRMISGGEITENKAGYQVHFSVKDGSVFLRKKDVGSFVDDWDL